MVKTYIILRYITEADEFESTICFFIFEKYLIGHFHDKFNLLSFRVI